MHARKDLLCIAKVRSAETAPLLLRSCLVAVVPSAPGITRPHEVSRQRAQRGVLRVRVVLPPLFLELGQVRVVSLLIKVLLQRTT